MSVSRATLKWGLAFLCLSAVPPAASAQSATELTAESVKAAARLGVDAQTVEDLVVANRILAHEGILDAYGHVSVRDPRNPNRYLIARSLAPEFVTADDIVEYDLDSNSVGGDVRAGLIERFIHGEIYKVRPDVKAIVHSHSQAVIPFSVSNIPLRPVFHMAGFLALGAPVWDSETVADPAASQILVRNNALGASLAATLGSGYVALLRGHGSVVVAPDVRVAVKNAIYLEADARIQLAAIGLGGSVTYISREEAYGISSAKGDLGRAWDYWKRRALNSK
jgi:HCOMODA/2-hydroxy-3-carboxy-muconic semialdehyde decarboxylase